MRFHTGFTPKVNIPCKYDSICEHWIARDLFKPGTEINLVFLGFTSSGEKITLQTMWFEIVYESFWQAFCFMLILMRYVALGFSLNTKVIWMLFLTCVTLFLTHLFVHAIKVSDVQCYVNPKILQNILFYVPWKKESIRFGISSGWTICFW